MTISVAQLLLELLLLVVGVLLTASGTILWRGINEMRSDQRKLLDRVGSIDVSMAIMNGRLGKSESWQEQHEKTDNERHLSLMSGHESIWKEIGSLRKVLYRQERRIVDDDQ